MATQLRERIRVEDYANYEQQLPDRDMNFRTVNAQPNYQGGYDYQYSQEYAQPRMEYPQQQSARFFQTQASEYITNGFNATPQYDNYNYAYTTPQELYQPQVQYNHVNKINKIYDRESWMKKFSKESGKKSMNKDMIKIIVTIMLVAIAICSLLIANQFITASQAQAEEDVQNIDSDLLASVVTENGNYVSTNVELIPEYEYEQSTNWFDKFCDSLGIKLK